MVRPKASAELAGPLGNKPGLRPAGADFHPSGSKVSPPVKHFKAPKESFENLDAEAVAALVASAGDIASVMDDNGVIRGSFDAIVRHFPQRHAMAKANTGAARTEDLIIADQVRRAAFDDNAIGVIR